MKVLTLKIRGLGSGEKISELRKLIRKERVEFLAIQETLLAEEIGVPLKQAWGHSDTGYAQQSSNGRSGGLLFL